MKPGLKLVLITAPLAALGALGLAYVVSNSPPPARITYSERASAVHVVETGLHSVTPRIVGYGVVTPERSLPIVAEVSGMVEHVDDGLRDGQIVTGGTVLVRLAPGDFNLAIAQAEANMRAAEARLAELDVSESNQQAALQIERDALAVKTADLQRAETLLSAGTLAQGARDAARAAHLAQRQKVQGIESTLALFPTQRAVQREQIAVYKATRDIALANLARSVLAAPFTARVASHEVETGQYLRAGQTAATLDDIARAEIDVQVSLASFATLVRLGQAADPALTLDPAEMTRTLQNLGLTAQVRLKLGDEQVIWPARVDRLSNGIDQTSGTVGVVVVVDHAYDGAGTGGRPPLTKGMFVDVQLSAAPIEGTAVPRSALRGGQIYVADADNRLRILRAAPRLVQGDIAVFGPEVGAGLRVVTVPPAPIIEGQLLDPHPEPDLMQQLLSADDWQ